MAAEPDLLVELGGLFLLLGLLGTFAWRVGISAVPLYLLAGLFFGDGGVVPATAAGEFLDVAAGLGVVLLLLALGMEFSIEEFDAAMRRHTPTGVVDFLLNAPPGFVAGMLLGLPWQGSLAMAGVTWVSSSGIVARTLDELGRLGFRETPSVLSVLVLEDIAMALYLPLLGVALTGGGPLSAIGSVVIALGLVLMAIRAAPLVSGSLGRLLTHANDEQVMLRTLGITLVFAGLVETVHISSAVGAFLVGLAIPDTAVVRARGILRPLRDLFAATFFLAFGYSTDPTQIWPVLGGAVALAMVTALTKVGTGWFAAAREGVGVPGRLRAGTALVARGEFSIVIAGLAVAAGIGEAGPFATAYVLVLAIAGPIMARYAEVLVPRRLRPRRG